jgi:hypothetical protein
LTLHLADRAAALTRQTAGKRRLARIAMTLTTTINSTTVKAQKGKLRFLRLTLNEFAGFMRRLMPTETYFVRPSAASEIRTTVKG